MKSWHIALILIALTIIGGVWAGLALKAVLVHALSGAVVTP